MDDVSDTLDGTTLFFYDAMGVIEEGRLDGSSTYQATHQYVWGLQYLDELILYDYDADGDGDFDAIDEEEGDQRYYCYHDYLYSVIGVGTAAGEVVERYDYEPYGKVTIWDPDYADTRAARPAGRSTTGRTTRSVGGAWTLRLSTTAQRQPRRSLPESPSPHPSPTRGEGKQIADRPPRPRASPAAAKTRRTRWSVIGLPCRIQSPNRSRRRHTRPRKTAAPPT